MAQQPLQANVLQQPLPIEVQQQAGMYNMGALTALYKPRFTNPLVIIALAALVIVVDIVLLIAVLSTGWIVYIFVIIPILAIIYAVKGIVDCNLRVYTFTDGLIRAKGKANDVIRYDQVAQVFFISRKGSYGSVSYTLTLVRSDGATFKISSVIQYMNTLGSTVQSEVVRRHMPQALEAFKRGNMLPFGPLTVSFQGIGNGKGTLPWNMVQPIILQRGFVIVKQIGQGSNFAKVKVTEVPNLPVFLGLVKYAQSPGQ
ncbi:MAG TPA: DUF6585 family protein [Ktedonobacteraceae bacterium]